MIAKISIFYKIFFLEDNNKTFSGNTASPQNASLTNLYYEYLGRLQADREAGDDASPNNHPAHPDTKFSQVA